MNEKILGRNFLKCACETAYALHDSQSSI